jgi:hypothetical protein
MTTAVRGGGGSVAAGGVDGETGYEEVHPAASRQMAIAVAAIPAICREIDPIGLSFSC